MWWLCGALAAAEIVDRVVVVVADDPVLASEIALDAELAPVDAAPVPLWRARPAEQVAVDAAVIRILAGDVDLYQPAEEAVTARVQALRDAMGDRFEAFVSAHGLDDAGLRRLMRRRMVVERFLTRGLAANPGEPDKWLEAYDTLLAGLRPRVRIRIIDAVGAPASVAE